jgi:uncharacterized protein (TIGR04255 family)
MGSLKHLPKFRKPPLTEVVHGVQFERLPMTIVHPGLFYTRIRDRFPKSKTVPELPPLRPTREPASIVRFADADEVPRAWFIEENEATLVQLQADRLLFNWRQEPAKLEYPHYDQVQAGFTEMYRELENFVTETSLGNIEPKCCEMTYINHIPLKGPDGRARLPHELLRARHDDFGSEWNIAADAVNWNEHYTLRRYNQEFGRLSSTLTNIIKPPSTDQALQLEITVYGPPIATNLEGVVAFHNMAHEAIVNYFTAITTAKAHEEWERIQ